MLEIVPWRGLQILWTSIIPMLLTIFTVMGTLFRPSPTFRDYEYPPPAKIVAAAVAVAGLMFVPSYAYSILSANNFNLEVVKTHATRWRPADPKFAREYKKRLMSLGLLVRRHRQEDKPAGGAAASATSVVGAAAADIIVIEAEKSPTTVEGAATEDASAK
ncbi:uncharacterized protein LOC144157991 [Haemaphysalis longicornis]